MNETASRHRSDPGDMIGPFQPFTLVQQNRLFPNLSVMILTGSLPTRKSNS